MHSSIKNLIFDLLHASQSCPERSLLASINEDGWDSLIRVAKMHRLGPALLDGIRRKSLTQDIPSRVKKTLIGEYRVHTLRNMAIYRELVEITRFFNAQGISSVALKGAYLAYFSYAAIGLRPMRDLDLLVPREQVIRAFSLLKEHGYHTIHEGRPEAYLDGVKIHLPTLIGPAGVPVELHHRLTFPDPTEKSAIFEQSIWENAISKPIGENPVSFLCAEDMLFHLCYHATFGHQFSIGPLALMDILMLTENNNLDWLRIIRKASGEHKQALLAPLYLAKQHLKSNIPDWVLAELGATSIHAHWIDNAEYLLFANPSDHILLNRDMQDLLCHKNTTKRVLVFLRAIFPSRSAISTHYPVHEKSLAIPFFYVRNWHRLLKTKLPSLVTGLLSNPRKLKDLAAHKSSFIRWLKS